MTAVEEESASLASQCLALCQTLASHCQGQSFAFSLSIGSTFNFSMATNIQEKSFSLDCLGGWYWGIGPFPQCHTCCSESLFNCTTESSSHNSNPSTFCFFILPSDTSVKRRCRCRRMQDKSESTVQLYKSLQGHWQIFSESYLHLWCRFLASPDAQEVMWVADWLTNH